MRISGVNERKLRENEHKRYKDNDNSIEFITPNNSLLEFLLENDNELQMVNSLLIVAKPVIERG